MNDDPRWRALVEALRTHNPRGPIPRAAVRRAGRAGLAPRARLPRRRQPAGRSDPRGRGGALRLGTGRGDPAQRRARALGAGGASRRATGCRRRRGPRTPTSSPTCSTAAAGRRSGPGIETSGREDREPLLTPGRSRELDRDGAALVGARARGRRRGRLRAAHVAPLRSARALGREPLVITAAGAAGARRCAPPGSSAPIPVWVDIDSVSDGRGAEPGRAHGPRSARIRHCARMSFALPELTAADRARLWSRSSPMRRSRAPCASGR